ncbi:ParB/RepB/Spo0J family partition protein [Eubacterium ramulus]|jgi:ParB family chromosome partitioning protein|uniref:ParB/RepB/Spo0J family partition protein n=1 Tax=Eubacterium ramulus TaxID=39490 RepID=UPI0026F2753E|nr:ParB/Srx family N-terminal domain-containing protein [Eubacterium ramulus]
MAWNAMDALNRNTQAAVTDERPKARFRVRDINIKKMYSNDANFYSMQDVEQLAQKIYAVGLLENLTVVHDPCDRGEYRIIAGERRWRALNLLVERGYKEFEIASCQVKTPAEEHEEMVQLIVANAYRNKTVKDILEEEQKLKETLQYMKKNKIPLQGYQLDSGRLRDVISDMLNLPATKIAQIESINKRLLPEFTEELKNGDLTFSAAYELSGLQEESQKVLLNQYKENGLTFKEVKEIKRQQEEKAAAEQITGQMTINEVCDSADDTILKSEKTIEPAQETENEEQEKTPDVPVHMNNMEKTKPEKPVEIEKQGNGVADQQQRTRKIDENRIESVEIRVGTEKNEAKEYAQKFRELADIMDEIGRLDESENIESEDAIEEYENLFNKFREKVNEIRKVWQL